MRAAVVALLGLAACRADVEGDWRGHVGDEQASLALEQHGSAIEGDACVGGACFALHEGDLDESDLELWLDSGDVLSLTVSDTHLEGELRALGCDCEDDGCACRAPASFTRCAGPCR
jgi:hypothetical protein